MTTHPSPISDQTQLVNHFGEVGPTFKPIRQSVGATIYLNGIVHRRRAGLPLAAALVNMVAATRPVGMPGLQNCLIVKNFTFRSTRSTEPLTYGDSVHMMDYRTTTTPDRCA